MAKKQNQAKHSSKKVGRWLRKPSYKRYIAERRWIKNKARKIRRYMKKHPNWKCSTINPEVKMYI